jgi:hypothetical protein
MTNSYVSGGPVRPRWELGGVFGNLGVHTMILRSSYLITQNQTFDSIKALHRSQMSLIYT